MEEFLTDQQQAARVRSWVREYAPAAVVALAIGIGGYFGYGQWQVRGERQAAEASELFEELRSALDAGNPDTAEELHQRLVSEFSASGYADHARLLMAREYVDTTRPALAEEELSELLAGASDRDLRQLARLRLARVYLYMDRAEEGLAVLDAEAPSESWEQLTNDMRGDLYRVLGRLDEAQAAYQAALDSTGQVDAGWIRMKMNYLAGMDAGQTDAQEASGEEAAEESVAGGEADAPAVSEDGDEGEASAQQE